MKNKNCIFPWVIIAVLVLLNVILIFKANEFKKRYIVENSSNSGYTYLLESLEFQKYVKRNFLFKNFPMEIQPQDFNQFNSIYKDEAFDGYLVVIFDFTVCGKCLDHSLNAMFEFKDYAKAKNIGYLGIVGIIQKNEEANVISMARSGQIFFPYKILNVNGIYEKFKLNKENFLDTPFFVYVSREYKVMDIFKPVYLDKKELVTWLEIILK